MATLNNQRVWNIVDWGISFGPMMSMMSMSHPVLNAGRCRCLTKYSAALRNLRCRRLFCPFLPISAHFRHFCKVSTFHCIARITKKSSRWVAQWCWSGFDFLECFHDFQVPIPQPKGGPVPVQMEKVHDPWSYPMEKYSYSRFVWTIYIYIMSTSIIIHHHPSSSIIHHHPSSINPHETPVPGGFERPKRMNNVPPMIFTLRSLTWDRNRPRTFQLIHWQSYERMRPIDIYRGYSMV